MIPTIETFEDLAKQTEIRYGLLKDSSTMAFFKKSTSPTIKTMWGFMQQHRDDAFVSSTQEGIEKVRRSKGKMADIEIVCTVLALAFCREICLSSGVYNERICQPAFTV